MPIPLTPTPTRLPTPFESLAGVRIVLCLALLGAVLGGAGLVGIAAEGGDFRGQFNHGRLLADAGELAPAPPP